MSDWSNLKERLVRKWQFPLFIFSLLMLLGAFWRVTPEFRVPRIDDADVALEKLISAGLYSKAIDLAEKTVQHGAATHSTAELAVIRRHAARAYYGAASRSGAGLTRVGERIVELYDGVRAAGLSLDPSDFERLGWAHEWLRDYGAAHEDFVTAIDLGVDNASALGRHALEIHRDRLGATPEEINQSLDAFLATVDSERHDLRLWAIEQKIGALESLGRLERASTLLVRHEREFAEGDLRDRFAYLKALLLYKSGHYDEAENYLRTIRNRTRTMDAVHAMTGWLLGRTVMSDGEPQRPLEALAFFEDVLMYHPDSPYAVASRVGQAEAFYHMNRHDDAVGALRLVLEDIDRLRTNPLVDAELLVTTLSVMSEAQRVQGNQAESLAYARLARSLAEDADTVEGLLVLQKFLQALERRAEQLSRFDPDGASVLQDDWMMAPTEAARRHFGEAAEAALELGRRTVLKEDESAKWEWRAAELFARAGQREQAVDIYVRFAVERPSHPLVPRAILRAGQLFQAMGRLQEAIPTYQMCYRRFPRTLEGARALVPLAECYLALGPGNEEEAEKTLRIVLEDSDVFTPQAPEFVDSLFLLGDILARRREFERAIATMEEALVRFPDDPRVGRTRFLLADAYRRSASALKIESRDATYAAEIQMMQAQAAERFAEARRLYRELINAFEDRGLDSPERLERVYHRHARLYEADCHFETQDYRQALKLYEEAAALFKHSSSGLAAYVQIINCHVFLGQPREARAALARAEILVDSMPDEAFKNGVSPETRKDWDRYFQWLTETGLF